MRLRKVSARGDEAGSFVSSGLRHQQAAPKGTLVDQLLTGAQLALWRWLCRLPEGWVTLEPPEKLRDQSEEALAAVAEDYTRVGEHYGLEVAYDTQRHMALHFEQATELKEHHIELIEAQLGELRRQLAGQVERAAKLEGAGEELRAANEALREELRRLHEDSRAAASNLISVARRSWAGGAGH